MSLKLRICAGISMNIAGINFQNEKWWSYSYCYSDDRFEEYCCGLDTWLLETRVTRNFVASYV